MQMRRERYNELSKLVPEKGEFIQSFIDKIPYQWRFCDQVEWERLKVNQKKLLNFLNMHQNVMTRIANLKDVQSMQFFKKVNFDLRFFSEWKLLFHTRKLTGITMKKANRRVFFAKM